MSLLENNNLGEMVSQSSLFDFGFNQESISSSPSGKTVESLLKDVKSAIGFDIAPGHTGVFVWRDGTWETKYWFVPEMYTGLAWKKDDMIEAKIRLEFKKWLRSNFGGQHFDIVGIEGCYGGPNYDTIRQLLNINSVFDELILEGDVTCGKLFRIPSTRWLSQCTREIKVRGGLNSKYKIQYILEQLGWGYYIKNKDLPKSVKEDICFEDICDAVGIILGISILLKSNESVVKPRKLAISQIVIKYLETWEEVLSIDNGLVDYVEQCHIDGRLRSLERDIKELVTDSPNVCFIYDTTSGEIGNLCLNRGLPFTESGRGYLVFYYSKILDFYI